MEFSISALRIVHLLRTERLGRRRIAERTGLSEMSVRLELEQLRTRGLVKLERSGCALTARGKRAFAVALDRVVDVRRASLIGLRIDEVNLAAHLHAQSRLPEAWKLRDEAIREGASGLILLVRSADAWTFAHNAEPIRIHAPEDASQLNEAFPSAAEDDLCLIVSGPTENVCAAGLWRAIRALNQLQN